MSESHLPRISQLSALSMKAAQEAAREELMEQVESAADLQDWIETAFNPVAMMRNFKTLEEQKQQPTHRAEKKSDLTDGELLSIEQISEIADKLQSQNYEMQAKTLLILRERLTKADTLEEAVEKLLEMYGDHALADEALDFVIQTTSGKTQLLARRAKEQLNEQFSREIKAGRNIGTQAREFSEQGLGSATSLRDLYREITGNPREPLALFQELSDKFAYDKLQSTILFLLHSLGADLKSKGPSIPRGELKALLDGVQSLQGILGIFRFFQSRMSLILRQFASHELSLPPNVTFETLAKQFVKLLAEKYINPEKILLSAKLLGLSEETIAQIIIYTQMRDALRHTALRYYRSLQHYHEVMKAMLEALEKLEDLWEEEEEEKEKEK